MKTVSHNGSARNAFGAHRYRSRKALGRDIAMSILEHRDHGHYRKVSDYTTNPETVVWVRHYMYHITHPVRTPAEQERRADQQAWLDSLRSGIPASLARDEHGKWLF